MVRATRSQRTYYHRLRNLVSSTGQIQIALDCGVPRSTARGWLRTEPQEVVSVDGLDFTLEELRTKLFVLREKYSKVRALLRLFIVVLRVSGVCVKDASPLPGGGDWVG